ncbi:flagellar biosynthesis protein FlhB [Asticcacaulis sp. BYS171W]|uniref:Flagellar biosynthetic protein FlhB n=1 Tax=Asticcacaulis aquaticus TaxID=2984212 RepID=A0ABT5HVT9_9CAUL|nr:flagellar biosynthesis protein FlhB [Asticcacaulis aquaticus]MDC7683960.1 flagellar biosynthesis protein FlhB [Asticcacaulis aquaticus]
MAEEGEDKTEEASAQKLAEARKKGDVAKSGDIPQALSLIFACALVIMYGEKIALSLTETLTVFVAMPHQLLDSLRGDGGLTIANAVMMKVLPIIGLIMLVAAAGGVIGNVAQTGLMFNAEKLKPDWTKLNPMAGFKRLFGVDALIQFAKTLIKLVAVGFITYLILKARAIDINGLTGASPMLILPYSREVFISLAVAVCLFLAVEGGADFVIQKFRFAQKMKMSKTEVKDEYKQAEGDPHVKGRLKQIRMEKSRQRMMSNVPKATVVITNPTHYAVALRYDNDTPAPTCVAKGVDAVALKIREVAGEHDIAIVEDPPLARALYAAIDVDEIIPEAHFQAVAKIISFVMTRKKRGF